MQTDQTGEKVDESSTDQNAAAGGQENNEKQVLVSFAGADYISLLQFRWCFTLFRLQARVVK